MRHVTFIISVIGLFNVQAANFLEKVNDDFMKHVFEMCAKPDIIELDKSVDGYVEVEFICDGKHYEIGVKNNKLLFCEFKVGRDDVPYDKIQEKLEKDYRGWVIDEISRVVMPDTTFIKVELINHGIEHNLYFTNDGKWYKINTLSNLSNVNHETLGKSITYRELAYNFLLPDVIYELPEILKEVSGVAVARQGNIYCIQDELGAIFEFNIQERKLDRVFRFTDVGDFEGLASDDNHIYILRSDGKLFIYGIEEQKLLSEHMLISTSLNHEGVCLYNNHFYTVSKETGIGQLATKRSVFISSLENPAATSLFFEINIDELNLFIKANYPSIVTNLLNFNPSAIEVHPITGEIYVLSAEDGWIAIYKDKILKNLAPLPTSIYHKPEGMTFFKNGDLLISSEGRRKVF